MQALSPNDLVRRGCIQVMEGRHCFGHLSVEDNLMTGAFTAATARPRSAATSTSSIEYFPRLKLRRHSQAGYTSGGEQQMTAIGRALMSRPKMILLDEPSMGLAPQLVEEIFEHRRRSSTRSRACPSCSPSRTPTSRCASPNTATSWNPAASCSTARRRAARERGRQGILSRHRRRGAQIVQGREAL